MTNLRKDSIAVVCVSYMCSLAVWHGATCAMLTTAACLVAAIGYLCMVWFSAAKPTLESSSDASPPKPSALRTREVLRCLVEPEADSEYRSSDDEWLTTHGPSAERVRLEADEIIRGIHREAHLRCSDEIVQEARRDAELLREAARSEAEAMLERARQELEEEEVQRLRQAEQMLPVPPQPCVQDEVGGLKTELDVFVEEQMFQIQNDMENAISSCIDEHFNLLQPDLNFSALCGNLVSSESTKPTKSTAGAQARVAAGPCGQGFGARRKQPVIVVARRTPNAD